MGMRKGEWQQTVFSLLYPILRDIVYLLWLPLYVGVVIGRIPYIWGYLDFTLLQRCLKTALGTPIFDTVSRESLVWLCLMAHWS